MNIIKIFYGIKIMINNPDKFEVINSFLNTFISHVIKIIFFF